MNNEQESKKATEGIKTFVIILLAISALIFGWQTRIFNDFLKSVPFYNSVASMMRGATVQIDDGSSVLKEAARPNGIMITDENGAHYGVRYDTAAKNAVYDRISGLLGEALGSAVNPKEITEDEWRRALMDLGVYYEYMTSVELSVLAGWFGADKQPSGFKHEVRRVCISMGGDMNKLYFQDENNGLFYEASTASTGGRELYLGVYAGNGVKFAFETDNNAAVYAPYMIIFPDSKHPVLRTTVSGIPQEILDVVLSAYGSSSQIRPSYTDTDGALNYVGSQFNVKVNQNGKTTLQRTDNISDDPRYLREGEMIERARVIAAETVGKTSGDAEVFFYNGFYNDDGSYSVTFVYHAAGGRVFAGDDGLAADITFSNGVITRMEMVFKSYGITDEIVTLLPETQALAAAESEFILCYNDTGSENKLLPEWVRSTENL